MKRSRGELNPYLFGRSVCALEQPRVREDEELEGVFDPAEITDVHNGQAVQLVEAGVLEPAKGENEVEAVRVRRS